ncbi:MAG: BtpA/SgcQ family protein [Planctomycetes bacterium]|nr:BtpA/SgcQ family protein [Planctomycetota bacterium]
MLPPRSDGRKLLIGVIHLHPLPGSPRYRGDRREIQEAARRDAGGLSAGGMDGAIVENYGDAPFAPAAAGYSVVAEMSAICAALREGCPPPFLLGVNVLRNDADAAVAIAAASGADFVRVNVHTGVMFTDQGIIEGRAHATLRLRRALECDVAILADVAVKHATPPPGFDLEQAARDAVERGGAAGLIVTGPATGRAVDLGELARVRAAAPDHLLFAGSGVTPANAAEILAIADGAIVGTALKVGGVTDSAIDVERVRAFVRAARSREAGKARR